MTGVGVSPLNRNLVNGCLKRARPEQELDDIAFVRLQPVELDRRNRSDVEPVDMLRVDQRPLELRILVIALQTSVGPILLSISSCGHLTTLTNGNMNSVFASVGIRRTRNGSPSAADSRSVPSRPGVVQSAGCMINARARQGWPRWSTRSPARLREP